MRLTQKAIESFICTRMTRTVIDIRWDDELPNFGVRVWPSGKKTFVVRYYFDGRRRYLTLGPYGVLTLTQARVLAKVRLSEVLQGVDPMERRRQELHGTTFGDLAREFMDKHSRPKKGDCSNDEQKLADYVLPAWKNLKVEAITAADAARLHHRIGNFECKPPKRPGQQEKERWGGKTCANRTLSLVRKMFNMANSLVGIDCSGPKNPAIGIEFYPERKRDRFVTRTELPKLAKAIAAEGDPFLKALIWCYLLTGMRKSELRVLEWKNVDLVRGELRLEDTKAGRTTRMTVAHYLPITAAVRSILEALPRFQDNPYVFCGRRDRKPLVNIDDSWQRIRKAAGLEDVWIHDLRRTLGSWMAEAGVSLPLIGKTLNHSNPSTTQRYARFQLDPVAKVLEDHGSSLMASAAGAAPYTIDVTANDAADASAADCLPVHAPSLPPATGPDSP